MTTWVLFFWFTFDKPMSIDSIQNLKSLEECNRVAIVMKSTIDRSSYGSRCIEVYTK
jgi:hypothetical protein